MLKKGMCHNKIFAVCLSSLVTLIFSELVMQLVDYPNLKYEESLQRFRSNELYHHFHAPGEYYKQFKQLKNGDLVLDKYLKFDSMGLRDLEQKKGLPKIIFIGDSFVEAFQVDINNMFGNLVESMLGNVDIVNVGCSSWSSMQYYLWLKRNLDNLGNIKSVYLFYCPNDPFDSARYLSSSDDPNELKNISFNKYFQWRVQRGDEANVPSWKKWIRKHIKTYLLASFTKNKIKEYLSKQKKTSAEENNPFIQQENTSWEPLFDGIKTKQQQDAVNLDNGFIIKINNLLKARNITFTLIFVPLPYQVSDDENLIGSKFYSKDRLKIMAESYIFQDFLAELAGQNNFRFFDLTPQLKNYKKYNPGKMVYNIKDGHFSKDGHYAVAQILFKTISNNSMP